MSLNQNLLDAFEQYNTDLSKKKQLKTDAINGLSIELQNKLAELLISFKGESIFSEAFQERVVLDSKSVKKCLENYFSYNLTPIITRNIIDETIQQLNDDLQTHPYFNTYMFIFTRNHEYVYISKIPDDYTQSRPFS